MHAARLVFDQADGVRAGKTSHRHVFELVFPSDDAQNC